MHLIRLCDVKITRSQTDGTPEGEIKRPPLRGVFNARTWPKAGCPSENNTTAVSVASSTLCLRLGFWGLASIGAAPPPPTFTAGRLIPVENVVEKSHHRAGAGQRCQAQLPELAS